MGRWTVWIILVLLTCGLWGCTSRPATSPVAPTSTLPPRPAPQDPKGIEALAALDAQDHEHLRETLLDGADPNTRRDGGYSLLHIATMNALADAMRVLIEGGATVDILADSDRTPLHWAAALGYAEGSAMLNGAGADLTFPDGDGLMPIHLAARRGHSGVIEALIAAGADVNAVDADGNTARTWARACGDTRTIKVLRDNDAE